MIGESMLEVAIPGYKYLKIFHLVLDYNGTVAFRGQLLDGVHALLRDLAASLTIHILTADTFGTVQQTFHGLPCIVSVICPGYEDEAKLQYIQSLGPEQTIAIGNGRNDRLMLEHAALGIAVIGGEGAAADALRAADIYVMSILDALGLLANPRSLQATLRL